MATREALLVHIGARHAEAVLLEALLQDQLRKLAFMRNEPCTEDRIPFVERLIENDSWGNLLFEEMQENATENEHSIESDAFDQGIPLVVYVSRRSPMVALAQQYVENLGMLHWAFIQCSNPEIEVEDIADLREGLTQRQKQTERLLAPAQFQRRLKSTLRTDPAAIRQFFTPGRRYAEKRGRQQGRKVARALLKEPGGFARVFRPGGQMARLAAEEFRANALKQTRKKTTRKPTRKKPTTKTAKKKTALRKKKTKSHRLRM